MTATRRLFVKTFGCQMNVYDSERMAELLGADGYVRDRRRPRTPTVILLNTCHIREKAAEKVYSELGRLRAGEGRAPRARQGDDRSRSPAAWPRRRARRSSRRAPVVDLVVGPQSYHRLPEMLGARARVGRAADRGDRVSREDKFDALPAPARCQGRTAFLTVQEGCDKFCTFCVVPYTRGAEFSRPVADIEPRRGASSTHGVREITLLGQNVNAYHGVGPDGGPGRWRGSSRALAAIDGLERIRYTTSHPRDMSDDLIAAHRDEPKLMPYLHLPFQAGADRMLAAMNRKHTADDYLRLVERIRAARPDIALSTDFIVGFPGETEADFEATLRAGRAVGFAQAYSFKYSPRPGTPAASMRDQVAEDVKIGAAAAPAGRARPAADGVQFGAASARSCRCCSSERGAIRASSSAVRPTCSRFTPMAEFALLGRIVDVEIAAPAQ